MRSKFVPTAVLAMILGTAMMVGACGAPAGAPAPTAAPAKPAATTAPAAPVAPAAPTAAAAAKPAATAPAAAPAAAPKDVITLKLASHEPPASNVGKNLEKWAAMVAEKTGGRVKVTVYHGEALGKGVDNYPMVEGKIADLAWVPISMNPGMFVASEVWQIPGIGLKSGKQTGRLMWQLYQSNPEAQKEWANVKLIGTFGASPGFISTTKKPVRTLEDARGLKLRAAGSDASNLLKALGITPVPITPPEMYESLSKGIIDGLVFNWQGIQSNRLYEPLNYVNLSSLWGGGFGFPMNKDKWASLPPDIQQIFEKELGGNVIADLLSDAWDSAESEGIENFKKLGKEVIPSLPAEDLAKIKAAAAPAKDEWMKRAAGKGINGQAMLDQALDLIAKSQQ